MPDSSRSRILFVIGSMGGGGAERQMLEILKRLDRTRFEPFLYLSVKDGELLNEVPKDVGVYAYWDGSKETWYGRLLRYMKLTRLLRQIHLAQALRRLKIDVIYDRTYLATLDAAGGCWLRPTKRVSCCVADPGPELELHARWSVSLAWWFARRAYQSASVVLANSQGLRNRVLGYFRLDPSHVKVYYNLISGIRESERIAFENQQVALQSSTVPMDRPFRIVSAGRLHPQKGHIVLLQAIEELVQQRGRTLTLEIYGKGESENELHAYIKQHRLESHVTMAGFVTDPRTLYHDADLFVLPSLVEGMPNALIEAVAAGVPAVSSDCNSGPTEILDGGRCGGLVPPGDPKALADAIVDAMDHHDEWNARAVEAQKRVEQMFDPETNVRLLEALLIQVIQG